MVRKYADRERDEKGVVKALQFLGATNDSLQHWMESTGERKRHGGLPPDRVPEAASKVGRAIKEMFQRGMCREHPMQWMGTVLFSRALQCQIHDRMLPLALQQRECVYGFEHINILLYKAIPGLSLPQGFRSVCGHCNIMGRVCLRCATMMRCIVEGVMKGKEI